MIPVLLATGVKQGGMTDWSFVAAISFIFWFGNQGLLKGLLFGGQIYGAPGIVLSLVFATFPHALMILVTALTLASWLPITEKVTPSVSSSQSSSGSASVASGS